MRRMSELKAEADRVFQHAMEVADGIIPENSPPTFIRSDWKDDLNGPPPWYGPDYDPSQLMLEATADPANIVKRSESPSDSVAGERPST